MSETIRSPRRAEFSAHEATERPLRVGVERAMVATLAIVGPLLVLQSMPAFVAERAPGSWLWIVSLLLVGAPCVLTPLSLLRRGEPAHACLQISAIAYLLLVGFERFAIRTPLPTTFTPWLIGLACIAFGLLAIGLRSCVLAAAGSAIFVTGLLTAYTGRALPHHLFIDGLGLSALAIGLLVGVSALRRRADRADRAERAAQDRFDLARRQVALEEERSRTDALLHDSVLSSLLVAAGGYEEPERIVMSARVAFEIVSDTRGAEDRLVVQTFERAVAGAEREIASVRGLTRVDLAAAYGVELPVRVAETIVAAMLQAVSNSIKHAGSTAVCVVMAAPVGDGGLRVSVRDDGRGFLMADIAPERLGVRTSILEQIRLVGGRAEIVSVPGAGTTVNLEWLPGSHEDVVPQRAAVHA